MADGKVTILVDVDGKPVKLLNSELDKLGSSGGKAKSSIKDLAISMGLVKVAGAAFSFVSKQISGLATDLEQGSATWKTFNGNMENMGKSKGEIKAVRKDLQDFATKTIYSASEMATTYSQLEAVGIKSSDQLVKGFGGLAAAAENPSQAMKTLSQQATQMAAKPMIQWQDFKLMLEQTPAGVAAVAKTMGMSTSELVKGVQDGTIETQKFFDAVTATGTNETFTKMATQYKNVGQAMDGLRETLVTKLQPAYDKVSQYAIDAIEKVIDFISNIDIDAALDNIVEVFNQFKDATVEAFNFVVDNKEIITSSLTGILTAILAYKAITEVPAMITKFADAWTKGLGVLKAGIGFVTSPVGLIVLAIGLLVAAIVYLWQTNETFRNKVIEIWNAIVSFVQPIIETITSFIMEKFTALQEWWNENQDSIFNKINEVWNNIVAVVQPIIDAVISFIMDQFTIVAEWWNENQQGILDTATVIWQTIQTVFDSALQIISAVVDIALTAIQAFWDRWGTTITTIVQVAWALISNIFSGTLQAILAVVTTVINQVKNVFQLVMNVVKNIVKIALGIMKGDWKSVLDGIKGIVSAFKTFVGDTFDNLMNLAKDLVSAGIDSIKGFFDSLWNIDLFGAGKAIIDGFLNGLESAYEGVKDFIGGIGDWIKDHKGPIQYDRKLLIPAGNVIMEGLDKGLQDQFKNVKGTIATVNKALKFDFIPESALGANSIGYASKGNNFNKTSNDNRKITTNSNPTITMNVVWEGKEDIRKTMQEIAWLTEVDDRGGLT